MGNVVEVERLIAWGANVNGFIAWKGGRRGVTPLHGATENGHVDGVERLIAAGADVNAASNDAGDTPLHVAMLTWNNLRIVELLIEVGWCRLTVSKPVLTALLVSALEATI
jgi:ankyrin repeat protein